MKRARTKMKSGFVGVAVATGLCLSFAVSGCSEDEDTNDRCVSNVDFFKNEVFNVTLQPKCMACHTRTGQAKNSSFILKSGDESPAFVEENMATFEQMAKLRLDGQPWILLKPSNTIDHGGGIQLEPGSDEYKTFEAMVDRVENPVVCEELEDDFFDDVELLDEVETLRKASLVLVGRLPVPEEEEWVREHGFEGLDGILDNMMQEDAFFTWVRDSYGDKFHVDRYYDTGGGTPAVELLDIGDPDNGVGGLYPNAFWFDELTDENARNDAAEAANNAIAREALELIVHTIRTEEPFTNVLTAPYTMVNWASARSYGVEDQVNFDAEGAYEFQPAQLPGVPHAGVLTGQVWLVRHPTTDTNRNRHRSRMTYYQFLATDVLKLGERPVDSANIQDFNPTMNNPNCVVCHAIVDPIAGAFQNWDDMGNYNPREEGWYTDMRQPGFGDAALPPENVPNAMQWAMPQLSQDTRFSVGAVQAVWLGLSGEEPLREPTDPNASGYLEGIKSADNQRTAFQEIADTFVEDNYNFKTIVKEMVKSPYFRAKNVNGELDEARSLELKDLGTAQHLTPELMDRKILATTGIHWTDGGPDGDHFLTSENWFLIFNGGINHDDVTVKITAPNGIMANVAFRMANEVACESVSQEFAKPPAERVMMTMATTDLEPEDSNGFAVPAAMDSIKAQIVGLIKQLWGEEVDVNDPQVQALYDTFVEVWRDGKQGLAIQDPMSGYSTQLPGPCQANEDWWTGEPFSDEMAVNEDPNYTIRSWMAVVTVMLADHKFQTN